jgi:hypothetical protein
MQKSYFHGFSQRVIIEYDRVDCAAALAIVREVVRKIGRGGRSTSMDSWLRFDCYQGGRDENT